MPRPFVPSFVAFAPRVALKGLESPAGDSGMVQLPHGAPYHTINLGVVQVVRIEVEPK